MILNSGLDAACVTNSNSADGTIPAAAYPRFSEWLRYACFGTGSTAPDPTDTSLDAQVGSRTDNRGGFSNTRQSGLDAIANTIWYETTFIRVFSITGNVNATEWGLARQPTGDLSVRDLFRADPNDPMSSPITLTLEDGDQLQLIVTLRIEAAWEYETKSFVITGAAGHDSNGTHEGMATVSSGATADPEEALRAVWPGGYAAVNPGEAAVLNSDQTAVAKNANLTGSFLASRVPLTPQAYVPGTHYRDVDITLNTATANGNHYAWAVGAIVTDIGAASQGYRFILTNPPYLTKESTHRLTLTVRKSIARL